MLDLIRLIWAFVVDLCRSRAALEAEVLVLRQQIIVRSAEAGQPDHACRPSTDWYWDGSAGCFRTRVTR